MRIAGYAIAASMLLFVTACASTNAAQDRSDQSKNARTTESASSGGSGSQEDSAAPGAVVLETFSETESSPSFGPAAVATPAASPAGAQDGDISQEAQLLRRRQELQKFQLQDALQKARSLMQNGDLETALTAAEAALRIDTDNQEAKDLYYRISALLGRDVNRAVPIHELLVGEWEVRIEQIKSDVMEGLARAKNLRQRGDYDAAIRELALVRTNIRSVPYAIDWNGIDDDVEALLADTEQERDAAALARREALDRKTHEELRKAELKESARREAITASMIQQAIDAFHDARYDAAIEYCDSALARDPRNEQAADIRSAAFRAGREKVRADYIENKREEFARWREHLNELTIPWTDVLTLPDVEHWRKITAMRQKRTGYDLETAQSPGEVALRRQLDTTRVRLPGIEDEESLTAVIDRMANYTGLPLVVDPAAENLVFDEANVFNLNLEAEVSARQALDLITDQAGEGVTWTIRHDAVLVTTVEKAQGKPVIKNHDVQDLVMGLTDFTGPRIDRLRLLDDLEDDDGGGPFGSILESPRMIEIEDLATLIQENIAVGTWDQDGVSIEPGEGFILITHSPEVQEQVHNFLEDLRRFNSSLVTIESRFMTVGDNWIQLIGNDFRGLDGQDVTDVTNGLEDQASRGLDNGGSGSSGEGAAGPPSTGFFYDDGQDGDFRATTQNFFGNPLGEAISAIGGMSFQLTYLNDLNVSLIMRAVEKSSQFQIINSQILSVHNTQRAYVTVINQKAYIQDFDVEVAQFQAVADPVINVLHEGVVLDVRPTIHHNRKYLTLEIQPTVAKVVNLRTFSTTLGGNTSSVDFQLPELEVQSVNTSAIIPDGGSILLGGLSSVRNVERRAEVPWIARVPVVGFLFKQEGYNDERKSLMILIRASIEDVRESVQEKLERRQ